MSHEFYNSLDPDSQTIQTFEDALDSVLSQMRDLLISKQADYGPHNISEFGELGVLVRTNDKMERLKQLLWHSKHDPKNESIEDTWIDIANYAVIALMIRNDIWGLPLVEKGENES